MIDIYARTFRIATFLDSEETVPTRRQKHTPRVGRLGRMLARWRSW